MLSILLAVALVAAAEAKQRNGPRWGSGGKGWSHQSWPEPSVYYPPQPEPSWPGKSWSRSYQESASTVTSISSAEYTTTGSGASTTGAASTTSAAGTTTATSFNSNTACAVVSKLVASFSSASPSATPTVPAGLAYDCITSVPFNSSAAVALMDSIRPYLNWQTTIEYLKSPPAEYAEKIQPPVDFYAIFDGIYAKAKAGGYANEYEFGFALYENFQVTHDGHFVFIPDSVGLIFTFGRTTPLVSVSANGVSIPEVYVYADVLASAYDNASFTPSPLIEINGQNATEWLLNYSQYGSLQDRDALWNNMFYILAQVSLGSSGTGTGTFSGGGRGRWIYPGPTTTLTFANGTTETFENFARVLRPFTNITNGEDIYSTYFIPPPGEPEQALSQALITPTSSNVVPVPTATHSTPAPGYPSPIIRNGDNQNSGYFLEGEGYDDVAVLSVPSFVGAGSEIDFQAVNTYLINRAVASNKTKLIIDVSANGGGTILQGYDLFKQLFPHILPYGATRFRAHEAFNLIGQEASYYSGLVPRSLNANATVQDIVSSVYNYRTDANILYEPFTSWAEKFGPHKYGPANDTFTSIIRWNMSDVLTPDNSGGIYISGYLNRSNITTQPFLQENIVVVYDGYCASTCTIFSELMRQQGGVKTIALGGRPNKAIIQAVGGVKGTNDYPYSYILSSVEEAFQLHEVHGDSYLNKTALGQYTDLPLFRSSSGPVVNARDGLRQGDASETPLQFRYETADCRIYYTPAMTIDETAVWKTVADTAFNGISHCIAGNYTAGTGVTKRVATSPRVNHPIRRDVDMNEHYAGFDVWTGMDGQTLGGDSIMYP